MGWLGLIFSLSSLTTTQGCFFHSSHVSFKYVCYAFFLLSHLSSTPAELKSTPNITVIAMYPNICLWLKKQEKYENKQRRNYDYNFVSNKQICMKNGCFLRRKEKGWKDYIKKNLNETYIYIDYDVITLS
jgi:hypothetical protein